MPDFSLRPMLATSWEPNGDATSYKFRLRQGVKFHDGSDFTADVVVFFSIKRVQNPATGSPGASFLDFITDVVALDDHTVRFDLAVPNAFLPDTLSISNAKIVPSNVDQARFATETFGTGPFRLTDFLSGVRATFVRNDDYWMEGRPYLDEVIVFYMDKEATRVAALKSGQVDALLSLEAGSVDSLETDANTVVSEAASSGYMNLAMDLREAPFDNILVRNALQAATDRELILKEAQFGRGGIAYDHPITSDNPVFNPDCKPPEYNPQLARDLLVQAGYPDGIDLTLYTSDAGRNMVPMAFAFKESAAATGIRIDVREVPRAGFWSNVWRVEPFTTVWWTGRNADQAFSVVYKSDAPWNESRVPNLTLNALIVKGRGQPNLEDRKATYGELQCLLIEEVPRIIPVFRPVFMGLRSNVRGLEAHPQIWALLHDTWLDE